MGAQLIPVAAGAVWAGANARAPVPSSPAGTHRSRDRARWADDGAARWRSTPARSASRRSAESPTHSSGIHVHVEIEVFELIEVMGGQAPVLAPLPGLLLPDRHGRLEGVDAEPGGGERLGAVG